MKRSRTELLRINQVFTEHLVKVQKAKYDMSSSPYKEGDHTILHHTDKAVILTKDQATQLNEADKEYFDTNKDISPFESELKNKWIGQTTLKSGKKNSKDYVHDLGESLEGLRIALHQKSLIILGDWTTPWLYQDNDYQLVKKALSFLRLKVDNTFNGGFELAGPDLIEFIPHLFWLARCNASLPEFMMAFTDSKTVITLCKYGILHLEFYSLEEQLKILEYFNKREFVEVKYCNDPVSFNHVD